MKWNNDAKDPRQNPLLMGINDKSQIIFLSQLNETVSHDSQCPLSQSIAHKWSWSPVTISHRCLGLCGCECAKSSKKMSESGICRIKSLFPATRSYNHFCNPDFLNNNSRLFCARQFAQTLRGVRAQSERMRLMPDDALSNQVKNTDNTLWRGPEKKSNNGFYNPVRL